jgi:hypothetical protein
MQLRLVGAFIRRKRARHSRGESRVSAPGERHINVGNFGIMCCVVRPLIRGGSINGCASQHAGLLMPAFRDTVQALKRVLDPHGVIAPGRYGIE